MFAALRKVATVSLVTLCGGMAIAEEPAPKALVCAPQIVDGTDYTICSIDLKIAKPKLFWKNADGEPYRAFGALAKSVEAEGKSLTFAMNAGMYDGDYSPMGLHVEDGRQLRPANTFEFKPSAAVVPNFYKQPNGVFFLDGKGAGILPTKTFLKRKEKPVFATQSGPMLVMAGELNSIFIPGSTDRKLRSGVGICEGDRLRFAISDDAVNFHDFATLFRDTLKCSDALFLDGGRGAGIFVPALGREDWSGHGGYGPIVGLVE
ncbi:phosphodiester glycosidase family protein [Rhizobium sp.]